MINFKKFLLRFTLFTIGVAPLIGVTSCSKINKNYDLSVKFNWDENQKLAFNQIAYVKISNFDELKKLGFTNNMVVNIKGDSVKQIKTEDTQKQKTTDTLTFAGIGNGKSTVTVNYVNVTTQKIASGSFNIEVIDYSKIKIDYNSDNDKDNPFEVNTLGTVNIGKFKKTDWNIFSDSFKKSLKIESKNVDSSNNNSISDVLDFSINNVGEITGKVKVSSDGWKNKGEFNIKVFDSQNLTNFKDDGHNFWLDKIDPTVPLNIKAPDDVIVPYNGNKDDYNKNLDISDPIILKVQNNDFDFNLATNSVLEDIASNIKISSINNSDIITNLVLEKDVKNRVFKLKFKFKEISFSDVNLKINFMFSSSDKRFFGESVNVVVKTHRHGVEEVDNDISKREIKMNYKDNDSFEFGVDNVINKQDLINPFSFDSVYTNPIIESIKNNGYNYLNSVVLSSSSFDKIKSLDIKDSENKDEIKKQNDAIQQIAISESEKNIQNDTGVTITADWKNDRLVLSCPGIKIKDDSYKGGEYFIVSKYNDDKNNYQFTYVDFKWKSGKIDFPTNPYEIKSHLYSMPIEQNSSNKENFDDIRAGDNLINGEDTGAGTIDNPLMLTETDSTIGLPDSSRKFSQNVADGQQPEINPYRGFLEIDNIKSDEDIKAIKISIIGGESIVKLNKNPIIKGDDNNYYINMQLIGQGKKDVKASKFSIKISSQNQTDYIYDVYYSAYIGAGVNEGDFVASNFITTQTSIFVANSASDRALYLGLSTKSNGSIKDVFFNGGYTYIGTQGAVTSDVGPNEDEPEALKNVENLTFGGPTHIQGSYIFMASPNSGINGYITFCDEILFTSSNNYTSASNKSDDPGFNNSAILLGGNLRNKAATSVIGEKGITLNNGCLINLESYTGDTRIKDSVSLIATTKNMTLGSVTIDAKQSETQTPFMFETSTTHIRDTSVITNEIIPADENVLPDQKMGNINFNTILTFAGDVKIENYSVFNGIVVDKNAFNPHLINSDDNNEMAQININLALQASISDIKTDNIDNNFNDAFIVLTDLDGSNYGDNYVSSLPTVNVKGEAAIVSKQGKHQKTFFPLLAKGKYNTNQTGFIKCNGKKFNYSNLNNYYENYYQFEFNNS